MATQDLSVDASADDASYRSDCTLYSATGTYPPAGYIDFHGGITFNSVMNFGALNIPHGATINSGYLSLYADSIVGTLADCHTQIRALDADAPSMPANCADCNSAAKTTAKTDWDPAAWVDGTQYNSPDIAAVIQELVNRPGWSSGNTLIIFWYDDGSDTGASNYLKADSWDEGDHSHTPTLHVDYTAPAAGAALPVISGESIHSLVFGGVTVK